MTIQEAIELAVRNSDSEPARAVMSTLAGLGLTQEQVFEVVVGVCPTLTFEAWQALLDPEYGDIRSEPS